MLCWLCIELSFPQTSKLNLYAGVTTQSNWQLQKRVTKNQTKGQEHPATFSDFFGTVTAQQLSFSF